MLEYSWGVGAVQLLLVSSVSPLRTYVHKRCTTCTLWCTDFCTGCHNDALFILACHRWRKSFTSFHQVI